MVAAIILASGYSRRMGENKLLLKYRDKYIIEYVMEAVTSCNFKSVLLVGKDENVLNLANNKGIKTLRNIEAHLGQSQSIKLGIKNSSDEEGYMFFTGDQPFIDKHTINLLLNEFYKYNDKIIVPRFKGRRGSPVIFSKGFSDELLALEGDKGGSVVINNNLERVRFVEIENPMALTDIDTKEDYVNLCSIK